MKYNKSLASLALIAGLGLTLSACGSSTANVKASDAAKTSAPVTAPTATPIPAAAPAAPPTTDAKKSIRGNLLAAVGDTGTISSGSTGQVTTKFTVNSIKEGTCDQPYAHAPENGHVLFVDVTVETTPELAQSSYPKYTLSSYDFKFISKNGTTFNGDLGTIATYSCIADAAQFPSGGLGPAEKAQGVVVLDVPETSGILVLKSGISGGFEYNF